jgi:transcriptional regulator with XRE-family HTH domain
MYCQMASRPRDHPSAPEWKFASNLREERRERGLTQRELGRATGLHSTEISLLERAARSPKLETIVRLARALGVSPAELLHGVN